MLRCKTVEVSAAQLLVWALLTTTSIKYVAVPLVALATMATITASQPIINGAFVDMAGNPARTHALVCTSPKARRRLRLDLRGIRQLGADGADAESHARLSLFGTILRRLFGVSASYPTA
jgi:hypothetical protein